MKLSTVFQGTFELDRDKPYRYLKAQLSPPFLTGLLSASFVGGSFGQERTTLFLREHVGFLSRICGDDPRQQSPEDSFGTNASSFGPCVTAVGAGKCMSSADAYYNTCRKDDISLEFCQASVAKLSEAVGIDYDSTTSSCYALFPGVGLTKEDLEAFCPNADEITFFYPETSGFPVDAQSNVESYQCYKCTRG